MKEFVKSQMSFDKLKAKESENKFTNQLIDLTWLLHCRVKHNKYRRQERKVQKQPGRKSTNQDKIRIANEKIENAKL